MSGLALFLAAMATALALGPALAHVMELPHKIGLSQQDYFIVQQIYAGWDKLAFVLIAQLAALIWLGIASRHNPRVLVPTLVALASLIAAQVLFWAFTFPANKATDNWTQQPADWEPLRAQWEWSHFGGAMFQLIAMAALVIAALRSRPA